MTGYKDPPKASQFPKGVSGNPNGRRKGKTIVSVLEEELGQLIELREGSEIRTIPKQRVLIIKLIEMALAGDLRAIAMVLNMCPQRSGDDAPDVDDESDREILEVFSGRGRPSDQT